MSVRTYEKSFSGGEMTPEFWGRIDDAKYQTGLATMRNFIAKPQGPAENRPGTIFVREVKDSTQPVRVIDFTYSTTQTMVIEIGGGYFRFHTQGGTLLYPAATAWSAATAYNVGDLASSGGVTYYARQAGTNHAVTDTAYWYAQPADGAYEIPNSFAAADLFALKYVQSADVLTLTHVNYPPQELRRTSATNWVLTQISFVSALTAPTSPAATANTGSGTANTDYYYVITAVGSQGIDESLQSAQAHCNGNLFGSGAYNTVTWTASVSTGTERYYVYRLSAGVFGYIGQTTLTTFTDNDIAPDVSKTPPIGENPFDGTDDYPGAVSYFEQRRCFAGTLNSPQNMWLTKSGTESNMNYSLPFLDDDSIQFRVAAREANTIRHIVPLSSLLLLTSAAEWRITSINSDALTPSDIDVKPQSYIGANDVTPVIVANNVLYAAARGGHLREMAYAWQANGYVSGDLSLRAPHLFDTYQITDMGYSKSLYPVVWCISTSGMLLSLTYVPEQQIGAWAKHDTAGGVFESVAVVAEGNEDVPYFVVNRTINGVTKRYIECLHTRQFTDQEDAFFVDCGLTYEGASTTTIVGLNHLEGQTVAVLGDGAVMPQQVVTGGQITLPHAITTAQIGLPITADLQTLPTAFDTQAFGQGRQKNVSNVFLRVYRSGGIQAGPTFDNLTQVKQRTTEPWGTPPGLKTEEIKIAIGPVWTTGGQICVRQTDPLPLTVVSVSLELEAGG